MRFTKKSRRFEAISSIILPCKTKQIFVLDQMKTGSKKSVIQQISLGLLKSLIMRYEEDEIQVDEF